ncbi:histone-lysine N-methyltransferase MLL5 [Clonorchis sinensis]|uniref:Histone-lysine N-methyltransferase MLL5 n=1 Tax=Clonorchis sinensis TaxID=79923 RepID=H2KU24_CLOSI|nr:histone-lysine N-methyltransferase MLL5 [Clonorchis sinensis]
MTDIRRKTTYVSRTADGRHAHNFNSFFQSSQKKTFSADPESGMRLVGPMFELTACVEMKGGEEDFDAVYPESSLSYGPTVCSFGLKYNDHNYGLPSGLTPPSMAPHLMDSHTPKSRTLSDVAQEDTCSRAMFIDDNVKDPSLTDQIGDSTPASVLTKPASSGITATTTQSAAVTNLTPKTESRQCISGSWETSDVDRKNSEPLDETAGVLHTRFKMFGAFEHMEMRYEPELKVIEVPEELAVSPSQLSDLDSDSDDGYSTQKINARIPTTRALVIDGNLCNGSSWPTLRCTCGLVHIRAKLIRCPVCSTYQHVQCMEDYYSTSLPYLCEGYVCSHCTTESCNSIEGNQNYTVQPGVSAQLHRTDQAELATDSVNANISVASRIDTTTTAFPDSSKDVLQRLAINEGTVGSQYVEITADRAKQLGLISAAPKTDRHFVSKSSVLGVSTSSAKLSAAHLPRDHELRVGPTGVDWERLNELSRSSRRPHGDTNVNLRVPSPPRTSKRKQDLTSTSYNDHEASVPDSTVERLVVSAPGDESPSASVTPITTPCSTPYKSSASGTPSTPNQTLTPVSDHNSSGLDSPLRRVRCDKRKQRPGRILFPDGTSPSKLKLNARVNPLGAVWAKDYQEAETNTYSAAMVDYLERRLSANLERNNRIPPSFMNRSSLCRVVLFDHDNKGLEASVRLSVNDVITEVRGEFMMLEEYEHHFDPISDYNRYVMFYQGFGDRTIVLEATRYGNSARFVRRSCIPNCRLDHTVVQGKFQLLIRASMELMPGTELTIPFDLDYRACRYPLECACARSRCPVLKWCRKLVRHKVVPNLDYSKYIESQLRVLSKPLSQESPNSRTPSFEHSGLTGSPLLRSTVGSSMSSFSNLNTSPTPSTRLRKELSDTNSPLEDDSTKSSGYQPLLRASGSCDDYATVVDENDVPNCPRVVLDSAPNQENKPNVSALLCEDADKIVFATQSPPTINRNST